jgi:hypothetical protein
MPLQEVSTPARRSEMSERRSQIAYVPAITKPHIPMAHRHDVLARMDLLTSPLIHVLNYKYQCHEIMPKSVLAYYEG